MPSALCLVSFALALTPPDVQTSHTAHAAVSVSRPPLRAHVVLLSSSLEKLFDTCAECLTIDVAFAVNLAYTRLISHAMPFSVAAGGQLATM